MFEKGNFALISQTNWLQIWNSMTGIKYYFCINKVILVEKVQVSLKIIDKGSYGVMNSPLILDINIIEAARECLKTKQSKRQPTSKELWMNSKKPRELFMKTTKINILKKFVQEGSGCVEG